MRTIYAGAERELRALYASYRDFDLLVDSRRLTDPDRTLFFALPGARTDGHAFLAELRAQGVRHFVVARPPVPGADEAAVRYVVCPDPLALLQDLAAHHRRQFTVPVVAITGSNGKTIVKDWLSQLLRRRFRVCASPRSYNSQIGVPLSVWRLRPGHEVAVFEAGVSRSGEMARLARIIQPTCGVFTVLGSAHAAGFASAAEKHREKMTLFAGAEWVAVPADDNASIGLLRALDVDPVTHLGVGRELVEVEERPLWLPFPELPEVYLANAYATVAAAYTLGVEESELRAGVRELRPLRNRLEVRAGLHGGAVINDSYSNDLSALAAALDFAERQAPTGGITLILGSLQPAPGTRARALRHAFGTRVRRLLTVGAALPDEFGATHYAGPEDLLAALPQLDFGEETILVKGASHEALHRVADALSRQQHRTLLRLDLTALRHNFLCYRRSVPAGVIAMVKASAYGGGALPVARTLAAAGAAGLAVAYPDEGRELRRGGLTAPILVLNAEPAAFPRLAAAELEPVVHDLPGLRGARRHGLRAHLEIDTGMGRLGFAPPAVGPLLAELASGDYADTVASVFTHLAASEDPAQDAFTRQQLAAFAEIHSRLAAALPAPPPRHVLNTNGISRFPEHAYEFVRLGIGLYGIGDRQRAGDLRPVHRFTTRVAQVHERPAGSSVGYNRRGKVHRAARIAVLSVGYADGLPRLAGEGRFSVRIGTRLAPVVGAVCMDMTMVDVTDLPPVRPGDEATIFGPEHPIDHLAAAARTIPYEILTGIGERVHRIYTEE